MPSAGAVAAHRSPYGNFNGGRSLEKTVAQPQDALNCCFEQLACQTHMGQEPGFISG